MSFYRPHHMRRTGFADGAYTHPLATIAIVGAALLAGIIVFAVGLTVFLAVRIT